MSQERLVLLAMGVIWLILALFLFSLWRKMSGKIVGNYAIEESNRKSLTRHSWVLFCLVVFAAASALVAIAYVIITT